MHRATAAAVFSIALLIAPLGTSAKEVGHYNGGLFNIRDFFVPAEPGVYAALYNYYYTTDRMNDGSGNEVDSVLVNPGPGPGVPVDLDVDMDLYAVAPVVLWSSPWKVLGARYGAYIAPNFANTSVQAQLDVGRRFGGQVENESFNVGDLFVQPVWLGWTSDHLDVSAGYGFYAPTGKYDTNTRLVFGNPITVEDPNNIGYGFWEHQIQVAGAVYPFDNKGTAIVGAVTYENSRNKDDFDLIPGEDLTLNWGISQYVPLSKDQKLLLEIGPAGWNGWQVSKDRGSDATDSNKDRSFAAGGQIGLTYVPWDLVVNFHAFYEYSTWDRFQGTALGLSIAKKLF